MGSLVASRIAHVSNVGDLPFYLSIFSFMKSVSIFIATWKTEAPMHWRVWNEPEFIDLYRQMFTYLWPVVFGKACEDANSDLLVKKRAFRILCQPKLLNI